MKRLSPTVAFLVLVGSMMTAAPVAGAGPVVRADVEGKPIAVDQIPNYYCHDHAFPVIHCFRTPVALEAAIATAPTFDALASGAGDYVIMYSGQTYSGSYMFVSQDYPILALVGWNDRVRSYRGLNSALGTFWTDWYASGMRTDFCCNVVVPGLAAGFDQAFSSVYRR